MLLMHNMMNSMVEMMMICNPLTLALAVAS
jgi:hypothetical protein